MKKILFAALLVLTTAVATAETVYDWATTVETTDKTHIKIINNQVCMVDYVLTKWPEGTVDTIYNVGPFGERVIEVDECGEFSVQPAKNCTPNIHNEVGRLFFNTCLFTMGVHFTAFEAHITDGKIGFAWLVDNTDLIEYYQLEESNDGGVTFHPVGNVIPASPNKLSYKTSLQL